MPNPYWIHHLGGHGLLIVEAVRQQQVNEFLPLLL
jgi:hypothetical protein